jgi:hypothetical protein
MGQRMSDAVFRHSPRTAGRIVDGLAFVVTPSDNRLHTLNAAGTEIWQRARDGCTLAEAAAALTRRFEVTPERAETDAGTFLADLVARGILEAG